ncbi:helix-hairpin-helix domain-containing protein [Wenjunlia vitaminophila]|uniref:helix-hairpin-helix domain-containing protein n=1 Tax=Wenjunlia vitaminophila TaxID=76728 RepID=UPI00037D7CDA|nr:helix-hairpin-helix domain-containing protein [Wenjunlia vitaminophila]
MTSDPVAAGPSPSVPPQPEQARPARAPRGAPPDAAVAEVGAVLAEGGAPAALAGPAVASLGAGAAGVLREDPWQVLSLAGVRIEQADAFARALLGAECGPGDPRRARALVVWLLERAAVEGHTAIDAAGLRAALERHAVPDPDEALREAVTDGRVLVFRDDDEDAAPGRGGPQADEDAEPPVRVLLALDRYALAEESLADGLVRLLSTLDPDAGPPVSAWGDAADQAPTGSAADLLRATASSGVVLHTGGEAARAEPAALTASARRLGLRAWAVTDSEDSRRRLGTLLGPGRTESPPTDSTPAGPDGASAHPDAPGGQDTAVVTLDGLLAGREGPAREADGSLAVDLLVVCDGPQLDVERAATLVESLPDGARLVLSGDPGLLWSAAPGRVFADLLAARVCPHVSSRTPDPGPIGELVSGIGIGELAAVPAPEKEVVIVPARDAGEAVHRTVQLVADAVPRALGVPAEQTQVITPGHAGAVGTRALNAALKARLNPGPGRFGGFDPGDRVVHVPAPGRAVPCTVAAGDEQGLHLDGPRGRITVPQDRIAEVRHGWALTAHQAVATRWPAVVAVLPGDAGPGLTRQWVYTAFGRAERHLSVVQGVEQALPRAVAEVPARPRTTRLRTILREQVPSEA